MQTINTRTARMFLRRARSLGNLGRRAVNFFLVLAILCATVVPLAQPAQAAGGLPTALFDPETTDWASVRNMTSAAFSNYFQQMQADGFMVVDIEVMEIDGQQRVGAIFQKNKDGRGWASYRNLTSQQFSQKWNEYKDLGYRLIDQESYVLGSTRYYAGVWIENKENLSWASFRNLTHQEFTEKFNQYRDAGFMPIDVEAYRYGNGVRYAVIWVRNVEGLKWQLWRNLSSSEYSAKWNELRAEYRVLDIESYHHQGNQYFAGIWIENEGGRRWASWRNMTAKQFGDRWAQYRDAGYRLTDYEVYATGNGVRYAGAWRQNSDRPDWALRSAVDQMLQNEVDTFNVPGLSVAIAHNNKFVYLRGFGFADVADQKIATSRTVYRLASVSKAIAGVLTMRMVDQNVVALADNSRNHQPALPNHHTHTIAQTLANRSGIGHYSDHGSANAQFNTAWAGAQFFVDDALPLTPGSYRYSTHAYTVLGATLEGATGQSIGNLIAGQLANPFGLTSLRPENRSVANSQRATIYNNNNTVATPDNISWKVLGGGMEGSAYDLARLGMRLLNGSMLSDASLDAMWEAPDNLSNYALGWNTGVEMGTQVVAKNGGQLGANSYIRMYPEKNMVIVVLSNRRGGGHSATNLGREIGRLMLEHDAAQPAPLPITVPIGIQLGDPVMETGDLHLLPFPLESLLVIAPEDSEREKDVVERNPTPVLDTNLILRPVPLTTFELVDRSPNLPDEKVIVPDDKTVDEPAGGDPVDQVIIGPEIVKVPVTGEDLPDEGDESDNLDEALPLQTPSPAATLIFVPTVHSE